MTREPKLQQIQELAPEQELTPIQEQQLQQALQCMRHATNGHVVNTVRMLVPMELLDIYGNDAVVTECLRSPELRAALEGTIARHTIVEHGEALAQRLNNEQDTPYIEAIARIHEPIAQAIRATLNKWAKQRTQYVGLPETKRKECNAVEQLSIINHLYPMPSQESYHRVRMADYTVMQQHHLQVYGGDSSALELSYQHAWLTPEILELAIKGDIVSFQNLTRNGRYIYGFDEYGKNSVRNEMIKGLKKSKVKGPHHNLFQGRILRTQPEHLEPGDDEIEAWLTSNIKPAPRSETLEYLMHGATGRVEYFGTPTTMDYMIENADVIVQFDTIKGDTRKNPQKRGPSAARIMAKFAYELQKENAMLLKGARRPIIDLYALEHLFIHSDEINVAHLQRYPLPLGANLASPKFFTDRALRSVARDHDVCAPRSERHVQGKLVELQPAWQHMIGWLDEFIKECLNRWKLIRWKHGDYSEDGLL